MSLRLYQIILMAALLLASAAQAEQFDAKILGLTSEKQSLAYWIEQAAKDKRSALGVSLLSADQVETLNQKLRETEPTYTDIKTLPEQMQASQIRDRINRLSKRPAQKLFDQYGDVLPKRKIDKLIENLNLKAIKTNQKLEFGLITKRAALRSFPTDLRAFNQLENTDIDRFQESSLFPGTPVAILQHSKDKQWLFIISELYSAWVKSEMVAWGSRAEVMAYTESKPRVVITDADARTAFTPERPEISNLALDMGISLPWLNQWPITDAVNGQGALGSHVISLPLRGKNGRIELIPALLPNRYAFQEHHYLPVSNKNLIMQSFRFLGERYGWGHDYGTRDCSGFVSEVYRSMGLLLPRNTSDQERSLAYDREAFEAALSREQRIEKVKRVRIGDLIYIPGHVMMVIGNDDYGPWVIHDSHGMGMLQNGTYFTIPTNGVAVTPLLSMAFSTDKSYVDAITSIQHIIPRKN